MWAIGGAIGGVGRFLGDIVEKGGILGGRWWEGILEIFLVVWD